MKPILQIVPRLPPAVDGVGDYAWLLAKQLRAAHGINTVFLVCDPEWQGTDGGHGPGTEPQVSSFLLDGVSVYRLREHTAGELEKVISQPGMPATILLQYVGYGYERRGCPVWLARGLSAWRNGQPKMKIKKSQADLELQPSPPDFFPQRQLVTMFHELSAFGPPWRSSFWTSPVQKWITKRLMDASDRCRTNTKLFAEKLGRMSSKHRDRMALFSVFSNVGEPVNPSPLNLRKQQMLIFGSAVWRRKIYTEHADALNRACNVLGIKRILDIGEPTGIKPAISLPVEEMGRQPAAEVSRCLAESIAGFLTYFDDSLAKSGVFAAYCAHGVLPVLARRSISDSDGIRAGTEYLSALEMPEHISAAQMQAVADNALAWYGKHSLAETAENTAMLISECPPPGFHP